LIPLIARKQARRYRPQSNNLFSLFCSNFVLGNTGSVLQNSFSVLSSYTSPENTPAVRRQDKQLVMICFENLV